MLEALTVAVAERRATVIGAKAAGGDGEREAQALEEAERALAERRALLAPEVLSAQHELERRAWSAHIRDHGPAMLEEGRARGDAINAVVRDVRARLVDAEARWKALDQELHWSVRGEYRSGSAGTGGIPPFAGAAGPIQPAIPRALEGAPTVMAPGGSVRVPGVPVEVI